MQTIDTRNPERLLYWQQIQLPLELCRCSKNDKLKAKNIFQVAVFTRLLLPSLFIFSKFSNVNNTVRSLSLHFLLDKRSTSNFRTLNFEMMFWVLEWHFTQNSQMLTSLKARSKTSMSRSTLWDILQIFQTVAEFLVGCETLGPRFLSMNLINKGGRGGQCLLSLQLPHSRHSAYSTQTSADQCSSRFIAVPSAITISGSRLMSTRPQLSAHCVLLFALFVLIVWSIRLGIFLLTTTLSSYSFPNRCQLWIIFWARI